MSCLDIFFGEDEGTLPIDSDPWIDGSFRLFMSHISSEQEFISEVKTALAFYGIDGFVAHDDIEPTKVWEGVIEQALATCDAAAAFLVRGFHESNWTDQEIGYCLRRRVLIVPVRMGLDPYGFIQRYQGLTPRDRNAHLLAQELFNVLFKHDLTRAKVSEALVRQLTLSKSFAAAKYNMSLIETIEVWTPVISVKY